MRQTDKQIELYKCLTNKEFRRKYAKAHRKYKNNRLWEFPLFGSDKAHMDSIKEELVLSRL